MFEELLRKIAGGLDKANIPYMIIGGQAVLLYGEPRLTKDIDITLGVGVDQLEKVRTFITGINLKTLPEKVEDFVNDTMVLPAIEQSSGIRVDFVFSFSPYERQAIQKANDVKFGETIIKFASLEDLIIHKIIAGRARDIEDVKSVLLKNPNYNKQYITEWLSEFDGSLNENFLGIFERILEDL